MTSPEIVATESLVFLVVGLKRFFKAPFAYFLVDKVSSAILSQIIKDSIILIAEAGFHVQALTCDGSYVNQAAMAISFAIPCYIILGRFLVNAT